MKKIKFLSLAIALVMLVSIIPMGTISASAATTVPTMPTTYPQGNVGNSVFCLDFGVDIPVNDGNGTTNANVTDDGMWKISSSSYTWVNSIGILDNHEPIGASGIMFYVDLTDATDKNTANFGFRFNHVKRNNARVWFGTAPMQSGDVSKFYYYGENNTWVEGTNSTVFGNMSSANGSGWYYIPFSSFYYSANEASVVSGDALNGWNYETFVSHSETQFINKFKIGSTNVGQKFSDVYFVYPEYSVADDKAAEADIYPQIRSQSTEGNAQGSVADGKLTVTGMAANSASASGNRVWVRNTGNTLYDMTKASGIKFYVDTTALGDARLQMRLRFMENLKPSTTTYEVISTAAYTTAPSDTLTSASNIQAGFFSRASVAYYYDESGNAVALHNNGLVDNTTNENDLLEALPAGYEGYIYIPMDSFYAAMKGSYSDVRVPFAEAIEAGVFGSVISFAICHAYEGTPTTDSVTYSDFSLVYDDLALTTSYVTLENDLSLSVKAKADSTVTDVAATFEIGGESKTVTTEEIDGGYVFTCPDILPQNIADKITVTVSGKINGMTATTSVETSVKEYCLKLLADANVDKTAKDVAADLLRYAAAAQSFAFETVDAPILDETTQNAVADFGTSTEFGTISTKGEMSATTNEAYSFQKAALVLKGKLAIKLTFKAASIDGLSVKVTVNGRENTITDIKDEGNGVYSVVCADIGADEMNATITASLGEYQTLTYSVADYVNEALADTNLSDNELALVKAIYAYGLSAYAYANPAQ